jgi:hypothetical protein
MPEGLDHLPVYVELERHDQLFEFVHLRPAPVIKLGLVTNAGNVDFPVLAFKAASHPLLFLAPEPALPGNAKQVLGRS